MALDDQLITRSNQRNNEADNSESGALGSDYEESSADRAGSLREEIKRGDLVILDQFIDFTKQRKLSFFEVFDFGPMHTPWQPHSQEI